MRTLLSNADYVITMDGGRRVIRGCSVAIVDGKVAKVGKKAEVDRAYRKGYFDRVIDVGGKVVTPGFVDTHVHTHEHLARGLFPDDLTTNEWTRDWAYPVYGSTTPESEYVSALLCCADMLRTGTTCFLESGVKFPESLVRAVKETGIRAAIGPRVMDNPPARAPAGWPEGLLEALYFSSADEAVKELEKVANLCEAQADSKIRAFVTINGKSTCSDELYRRASDLSKDKDLGMHFHMASSWEEAKESERKRGCWPMTYLEQIGVLQERVVVAHATAVKDEEVGMLAKRQVKVSFCPGSAFKLGKGASTLGKYPEMIRKGVTVSVGSDGAAAAGSFDMIRQIQMAGGIIKDGRRDSTAITAEKCLEMGTIDGAKSLRWDAIGSIEEGKSADLVVFDAETPSWMPLNDPVQNLVYSASGESVEMVLVEGAIVVESGRLTTFDEERLSRLVAEETLKMVRRSGLKPRHRWAYS